MVIWIEILSSQIRVKKISKHGLRLVIFHFQAPNIHLRLNSKSSKLQSNKEKRVILCFGNIFKITQAEISTASQEGGRVPMPWI